jgi:hypothetical protein
VKGAWPVQLMRQYFAGSFITVETFSLVHGTQLNQASWVGLCLLFFGLLSCEPYLVEGTTGRMSTQAHSKVKWIVFLVYTKIVMQCSGIYWRGYFSETEKAVIWCNEMLASRGHPVFCQTPFCGDSLLLALQISLLSFKEYHLC